MNGFVFLVGELIFLCLMIFNKNLSNEESTIFLSGCILCGIFAASIFIDSLVK